MTICITHTDTLMHACNFRKVATNSIDNNSRTKHHHPKILFISCTGWRHIGHCSICSVAQPSHTHRCPHGRMATTASFSKQTTHSEPPLVDTSAKASCSLACTAATSGLSLGFCCQQLSVYRTRRSRRSVGAPAADGLLLLLHTRTVQRPFVRARRV